MIADCLSQDFHTCDGRGFIIVIIGAIFARRTLVLGYPERFDVEFGLSEIFFEHQNRHSLMLGILLMPRPRGLTIKALKKLQMRRGLVDFVISIDYKLFSEDQALIQDYTLEL